MTFSISRAAQRLDAGPVPTPKWGVQTLIETPVAVAGVRGRATHKISLAYPVREQAIREHCRVLRIPTAARARDPDMCQTRKDNQWYFGMKAHIGVDSATKVVNTVVATVVTNQTLK